MRSAVARRHGHNQIRPLRFHDVHLYRHRRGAVVVGVGLVRDSVHARPVVVRARIRRRRHRDRLRARPRCRQCPHRVRAHRRVRTRNRRVRRAVVPQRRCRRLGVPGVRHRRRQRERRARVRTRVAHSRRPHLQVRALSRRPYGHRYRTRAVVRRVRLVRHRVRARAVVVGARVRWRGDIDVLGADGRSSGKRLYGVRAYLGVGGRDRGVRRQVEAHRRGCRGLVPIIPHPRA